MDYFKYSIVLFILLFVTGCGSSSQIHEIRMDNLQKCYDGANSQNDIYECDYQFGLNPNIQP